MTSDLIAKLETRRKEICSRLGSLHDIKAHQTATKELDKIGRELGALYLAQDKKQRPEVYRAKETRDG